MTSKCDDLKGSVTQIDQKPSSLTMAITTTDKMTRNILKHEDGITALDHHLKITSLSVIDSSDKTKLNIDSSGVITPNGIVTPDLSNYDGIATTDLIVGSQCFSKTSNKLLIWNGTTWVDAMGNVVS